jgi:hypothetical protein
LDQLKKEALIADDRNALKRLSRRQRLERRRLSKILSRLTSRTVWGLAPTEIPYGGPASCIPIDTGCPSCQVIPLWYHAGNQCPRWARNRLRGSYFRVLWFIALLIAGPPQLRSA